MVSDRPLRVLIVEDSDVDADVIARLASPLARSVRAHALGPALDALRAGGNGRFDAVLLDLDLPDSRGLATVRAVARAAPDLPIVVLTANGDEQGGLDALREGAQDYLVKGTLTVSILRHALRYAIERSQLKSALARSETRLRAIVEHHSDAILVVVAPERRSSGRRTPGPLPAHPGLETRGRAPSRSGTPRVLFVNRAAEDLLGRPPRPELVATICRAVDGRNEAEITAQTQRGRCTLSLQASHLDWDRHADALVVSLRDVTLLRQTARLTREARRLRETNRSLMELAHSDPLTRCLNRRGGQRALDDLARNGAAQCAAILVDCDDFKSVNDEHGLEVGDATLREVAARVRSVLRRTDYLVRIGGDEFLALLPRAGDAAAAEVAERARKAVESTPVCFAPRPVRITLSLGATVLSPPPTKLDDAIVATREALQRSKRTGKNRLTVAGAPPPAALDVDPLALVRAGSLRVEWEPLGRLRGDGWHVEGWEASIVPPPELGIDVQWLYRAAARRNVLSAFDWACLRLCLEASGAVPCGDALYVNVRPSALADIAGEGIDWLVAHEIRRRLHVELPASHFYGGAAELVEVLERLRSAGITVGVDRVGSSRCTLGDLLTAEPSFVKVDAQLLHAAIDDGRAATALARLARMCRAMDAEPIALGIDSEACVRTARTAGFRVLQGPYLRPSSRRMAQPVELRQ